MQWRSKARKAFSRYSKSTGGRTLGQTSTAMTPFSLAKFRAFAAGSPVFFRFLLTDAMVQLAEISALVILPWWIASSAGVSAVAIYSASMALAMLVMVPLASPFGDRICKARQIMFGLAALCAVAAAYTAIAASGMVSLAWLIALAVLQVIATAFVDQARSTILAELLAADRLPAAIRMRKTVQAISGMVGPLLAGLALGTACAGGRGPGTLECGCRLHRLWPADGDECVGFLVGAAAQGVLEPGA